MLKLKLIESKGQHNGQVSVNLCIAVADISNIRSYVYVIYIQRYRNILLLQVIPASEDRARRSEKQALLTHKPLH